MRKRKASTPSEDASKRKRMSEESRVSGDEFHAWFNLLPDFVAIVDEKGKILAVNDAAERVGGFKREELVGKNFLRANILTSKSKAITMKNLAKRMMGAQIAPYEIELVTKDGEKRCGEVSATKIEYKGRPANLAVFRDITERKRAEQVLRSSEERLRILFEFAPDAYYLNDLKGAFIDGNKAAEKMTGFSRKELIGKSFLKLGLLPAKQIPKAATLLAKNALGQPTGPDELTLNRKDGSQATVEIRTFPVKIENETLILGIARDISERKKTEQELRESEERYRTLMEDAPVGICNVDLEGTFTFVNKRFEEASGYLRSQVIGKNAFTLGMFNDETLKILAERIKSKLKGEATRPLDAPFRRRDGEWIWVELEASVVKKDATPVGFQLISRDITERERMEETLKQSEVKLMALHRHARTLAVAKSIEEVAKHTLDAMEFTLGFDVADFCAVENGEIRVYGSRGVQLSPLKWPLDGPGVVVKSVNAKRTFRIPDTRKESSFVDRRGFCGTQELQPMFSELAVPVLKDDEAVAVLNVESSRLNAFTDEDQELLETLAMHIASALGRLKQVDTLERAVEERASELKGSEERYRRLVDNITDVVFTIDLKGNFTFCSPATEMMTGYSVQQLLSMNMKELIAPEHFPEIQERLQARIQGERYLPPHQFEIIKADGKRIPVEMTTTRIVEKGTLVGIQGIARDITERRQMEKKLREAERLAAIGETTAMVGHDLRNPLTGITGAVYILKTISNMKKDGKAKEFLDLIERNVEYSDKIISDLLNYSAELHLNLTTTNPKSIISDALRFMPIPKGIHVTDMSRSDTQLIADAEKLRRVAVNLITNAVDAMPEGGTLTISSRQSNGDVEIAFSDTGIGMTKETLEKLGTPLFTTKAKGMGFGLPIVRRIVEAHGGSIFVESTVGKGSTFKVRLPIRPELKEVNRT